MRADKMDIAYLGVVPECGDQPVLIFVYVEHNKTTHIIGAFKILYYVSGGPVFGLLYFSKPGS